MNDTINPADSGFYMPAEWEQHSKTWMAWPCREEMWTDGDATSRNYAAVANTIAEFEPVNMVVPHHLLEQAGKLLSEGDISSLWQSMIPGPGTAGLIFSSTTAVNLPGAVGDLMPGAKITIHTIRTPCWVSVYLNMKTARFSPPAWSLKAAVSLSMAKAR